MASNHQPRNTKGSMMRTPTGHKYFRFNGSGVTLFDTGKCEACGNSVMECDNLQAVESRSWAMSNGYSEWIIETPPEVEWSNDFGRCTCGCE